MKNVLFVCTGNSCRSVMAAGLFKKLTEHRHDEFIVGSAGITALDGYGPTQETVDVMALEGVDVTKHRSRRLTPAMVASADIIYVMDKLHREWILRMDPKASEKTRLLTEFSPRAHERFEGVGIPDPIHMPPQFYRNVFSMVRECLEGAIQEL